MTYITKGEKSGCKLDTSLDGRCVLFVPDCIANDTWLFILLEKCDVSHVPNNGGVLATYC